jgi:hypothetical protein
LKKIQDGIRLRKFSLKIDTENFTSVKSVFAVLQASGSFEKIEMQEFSNCENLQFVRNTKFSKFSQNLSFYYRDLRPQLLQFTERITKKKLAGIGEPMFPSFGGLANIGPEVKYSVP